VTVKLGLLQVALSDDERAEVRRARVLELLGSTLDGTGLDLVVLPELWTIGAFDMAAAVAHPEPLDGDLVGALCDLARSTSTAIHAGSLPEGDEAGRRWNTSVLIDASGRVEATYRKIHLFGFHEGEAATMTHGDQVVVAPTPLGPTGLATCYDLRFPEHFRAMVDDGAEAFVVPAGWPQRRIAHWRTLLRARAIEDQAWVVGANAVGVTGGVRLGGYSVVVDPWGEVVAEASPDAEELITAVIDPSAVARARTGFPVLHDRRL
jgi:predicted amidohydrolase